ncbi:MAG: dihydroorotase [Actinomycetota bacterium]
MAPSSDHTTVLRGGMVLDQSGSRAAEVRLAHGEVVDVAETIEPNRADVVVDVRGCVITPGFIDLQAHLREPGEGTGHVDSIESGTAAAAQGGMTAVVSMPNTAPCIDTPDLVRFVNDTARSLGRCDVMSSAAMTVGREGDRPTAIEALYDAGVRLFTDDGTAVMDSALVREVMERVVRLPGAYVGQHCEDEALVAGGHINEGDVSALLGIAGRPAAAEVIVVERDLRLAELTGARYHVLHASSAATLRAVDGARARGVSVSVEVTPQHVTFTEQVLRDGNPLFKMNPPLRRDADRVALRDALVAGTIDAIATDHAPHPDARKALPLDQAAPGMTGLETSFAAMFTEIVATGLAPLDTVVAAMTWRPARISGLESWGHGGPVVAGSPANLAVIDPNETWTVDPTGLASRSANNPYRGRTLQGRVVHTFLRGVQTWNARERVAPARA